VRDQCRRHLRDLEEGAARGLRFDIGLADRAIQFFPTVLRLNGGQFEGEPFKLEPSQAFIVGSLFGWVREDGTRRFRLAYIEAGKGCGKSPMVAGIGIYGLVADSESRAEVYAAAPLALDTMVPTPDGWATQGELKVGDKVFDRNGDVCEVTYLSPILTRRKCFEIEFGDGTKVVSDGKHRWLTESSKGTFVVTTAQIMRTLSSRHVIRATSALREKFAHARDSQIFHVRPCESVPVRCIEVNSPDHLYLITRAHIATHNTKKDQAMILFRDAVSMVQQSPALTKRLKMSGRDDKIWNIFDGLTGSFFRPISSDDGQSGPRPHIGLIDELHEHRTPMVMNMMLAGRKWRRQPLIIAITNSGFDRHSVCWEYRQKGIKVASGAEPDDTYFPYICSLDEGDNPFEDEDCWIKANPLLGQTITKDYLRDVIMQARGMPSVESTVLRLNFCQWTESSNPFISYQVWEDAKESFKIDRFKGMDAIGAFDLSSTTDLTAFVLAFLKDKIVYLFPMFWIPADNLAKREQRDGVPYQAWVRDGHIFTTPGPAIDKDFVVQNIAKILKDNQITLTKAPYDRWRIDTMQAALSRFGLSWPLEPFGQGFASMSSALDSLEVAILEGSLKHPGNPVMDWNAANAVVTSDAAGNRKLDKAKATGRIDGIVAACMAVGTLMANKPEEKPEYKMFFV
jgi:phage terminase large subunit-like protein